MVTMTVIELINRFTRHGDLSRYRRTFRSLTADGRRAVVDALLIRDDVIAALNAGRRVSRQQAREVKGKIIDNGGLNA